MKCASFGVGWDFTVVGITKLMGADKAAQILGQVGVYENKSFAIEDCVHAFQLVKVVAEHYLDAQAPGNLKRIAGSKTAH